jgi:hypothetical protein
MGSNKNALQGPGVVRNVPTTATRRRSVATNVVLTSIALPVQEEEVDFVSQPVESHLSEMPSPLSLIVLPEISLPAFYLQSAVEPTREHDQTVLTRSRAHVPCPTCGCSSREHQNA